MPGPLIRTKSLTATGSGTIASAPGAVFAYVNVGTAAASATIDIRDGTSSSATLIATIDCSATGTYWYMAACTQGLYYNLSGGNAKVTIGYC